MPPDPRFDPQVRALVEEASTWLIVCLVASLVGLLLWGLGLVAGVVAFRRGRRLRAESYALGARPVGVITYLWVFGCLALCLHSVYLLLMISCVTHLS